MLGVLHGNEGATALSSARFLLMRDCVYADSPPLFPSCLHISPVFPCPGFGFCYWVRGARFGITTFIGLLLEF